MSLNARVLFAFKGKTNGLLISIESEDLKNTFFTYFVSSCSHQCFSLWEGASGF